MLTLKKAKKIFLKDHPEFDEQWLRKVIVDDTKILGLGELDVRQVERLQPKAGRLDLLLIEPENEKRYEVELMLGKLDESHIIRAIEYWDIERKNLPNYEHCAVIIAEEITSRFLNVISLFNGFIPLIALQLDALQKEDELILNFTKVLDEVTIIDEYEGSDEKVDRQYWESKSSKDVLKLLEKCFEILKTINSNITANYLKHFVGILIGNRPNNFMGFYPKKKFLRVHIRVSEKDKWKDELIDNGIDFISFGKNTVRIRLNANDLEQKTDFLMNLFKVAYDEWIE